MPMDSTVAQVLGTAFWLDSQPPCLSLISLGQNNSVLPTSKGQQCAKQQRNASSLKFMGFSEPASTPAFLQLLPKRSFQIVPTSFLLPSCRVLLLRTAKKLFSYPKQSWVGNSKILINLCNTGLSPHYIEMRRTPQNPSMNITGRTFLPDLKFGRCVPTSVRWDAKH